MNITKLTILSVLASKRHSMVYQVTDGNSLFVLKTPKNLLDTDLEAYEDEYETLKNITHPVLPKYYDYYKELVLPDGNEPKPAILMEHVDGTPLSSYEHLTTKELKKYILDLADGLLMLLENGVLYTDLHPGNLIIKNEKLKLIDFTKAYYFIRNPYPSYTPKISYQLDQNLKGQQLLIQALSFLLSHLIDKFCITGIPFSLMELGLHPHSGLSFTDYIEKLEGEWRV